MKQKRNSILILLGATIIAFFVLEGCQREENFSPPDDKRPQISLKTIFYDQLDRKQKDFIETVNRWRNEYLNRNNTDDTAIILDTTSVTHISYQGYNSYTYSVLSDQELPELKNIIVSEKASGNIEYLLVNYELDLPLSQIEIGNVEDHILNTSITIVDPDDINLNLQQRGSDDCWTVEDVETEWCQQSDGDWVESTGQPNQDCVQWKTTTTQVLTIDVGCSGGGGNDGPDPGDTSGDGIGSDTDGGTNGGGTNGTDDGSDDNSDPSNDDPDCAFTDANGNCMDAITKPKQTVHEKNCAQLKKLGEDQSIKNTFDDLSNKASSEPPETREYGYNYIENQSPVELDLANNNNLNLQPMHGGAIYGISHTHPVKKADGTKVFPMFSVEDIYNLALLRAKYNNPSTPNDPSLFVVTLTVKNDANYSPSNPSETYALKISNVLEFHTQFATTYNNLSESGKEKWNRELQDEYQNIFENNGGNVSSNYLKALFKFMNNKDINGVEVYKATDTNLNNWQKLNYDEQTNTILNPSDC